MERKIKALNLVIEQGMLPEYFHPDPGVSVEILKALYNAGIRVVEYINRDKTAIDNFLLLRKVADNELPDLQLGAGNIRNKIEATEFINEGAGFIVCPNVVAAVADLAKKNDLLWIPGFLSATEITLADDLGAQLVKLFPAHLLGPAYLKAMKDIFPDLLFMPSGGIETNEEVLSNWFSNGASAVALSSKLISSNLVETIDYSLIASNAKQTLQIIRGLKGL